MIATQRTLLARLAGIALCLWLAACVGGSSGGSGGSTGGSSATPAAFAPGQVVEVIGFDGGPIPPGQCRDVTQTAWVTDVQSVTVSASDTQGPDKQQLTCSVAQQRFASNAEQKCAVQFNNPQIYRNPVLLPVSSSGASCQCRTTATSTTCDVEGQVRCGFEAVRTETVQACN